MRCLIVEDDPSGVQLLKVILAGFGDVDEVPEGPAAIEAFESALAQGAPYDVIFLDIMIPGLSGHEVLKAIRERERRMGLPQIREVKVIMTTALDSPDNVNQAFCEGRASAYLVKPILRAAVLKEMKKLSLL